MKKIKTQQKKVTPKKVQESIDTRIARAVYSAKKISERIFGYIAYDINFIKARYIGSTQRPAKITAIEKGIIGILLIDETSSFTKIGTILGLDVVNDAAESAILRFAIDTLIGFDAIEGDDSCYALTDGGRVYAEKGERPDTYSKEFDIFIDLAHPTWYNIKNCISENLNAISEINTPCEDINLDLEQIKLYAENQAQDVHYPINRYLLQNAVWQEGHEASYKVYVCFVQNVATDAVRTFVYDENQSGLNELIAAQINSDEALKAELLTNCIKLECENDVETTLLEGEEVETAKAAISEEIKEAEKQIVLEEEAEASIIETSTSNRAADKERLHKKALYDSLSFEVELQKIFTEDNPDEIWLISPWIRKSAFMHERGPMIENFLKDENKRVFIAYSEPAQNNDGKPMVDAEVEPAIQQLEEQYANFFYVQLPEFHLKNVIEVKGDQKVLFSGSFNVLSFSVSDSVAESQAHVRREEMALAHHTVAKKKYVDCLTEFAEIYAKRIMAQVSNLKDSEVASYNNERLAYFLSIDNQEIKKLFLPIEELLEEKMISNIKRELKTKLSRINQELTAASNMSGLSQKDKKKYEDQLVSIESELTSNNIDDPSMLDLLTNNKELLNGVRVKKIFPGKKDSERKTPKAKAQTAPSNDKPNENGEAIDLNFFDKEIEATEEGIALYIARLSQAFINRGIRKGQLNTKLRNIFNDDALYSLFEMVEVSTSRENPEGFNLNIGVKGYLFRFPSLFYNRDVFENKAKRTSRLLTRVTPMNIDTVVNNLV